jgi:glycosyltransferase involved in cell wall biosynthesis
MTIIGPMQRLVFIGSHLGYPMDRTPLGGGAMVGLHLARAWSQEPALRLAALGSGPEAPFAASPTAEYVRLAGVAEGLVDLSELAYARFCRRFERESTEWLLSRRAEWPPQETAVVVNDISEGPDLAALKGAGYPIVSIWHVDVVDYFNKLYLKSLVAPAKVTAVYEALRRAKLSDVVPDVLKLVFEKQRQTVAHSDLMVLPSRAMRDTIERCYGKTFNSENPVTPRCLIQPWGALGSWRKADPARVAELRAHYQISPETDVVITLSRISPEKGIHLLIEAFERLEKSGRITRDTALIVCGEAAFMMGQAYLRKVRRAAARLKRVRVFFPGYLSAQDKPEFFALAQLFVSPSVHESYGLNVVEALRAGLPVLASDHYGVKDILKEEYGVRVPYESLASAPDALAGQLEILLNDKPRLKTMGIAAARAAADMTFSQAADNIRFAALARLPKGAAA